MGPCNWNFVVGASQCQFHASQFCSSSPILENENCVNSQCPEFYAEDALMLSQVIYLGLLGSPPGKPLTVEQKPALQHIRLKAKLAEIKRLKTQKITSTEDPLPINSPIWVLAGKRKKLDSVHRGPGRIIRYRPDRNTYLVKFQGAKEPITKKYHRSRLRPSKGEHLTQLVPTSKQLQEHQAAAVKTKPPLDVPK
ncbi:hypothetical protein DSO57_1026883 [Entomophthora muscae]|uniref:Uncharacterized protein n=1 Tax=Entomophthora muscae TaxID=34485 RepID=A0ACC2SR10_9FUNG|nr:hypothetical protein DSO57_1026883 [Entomophthora muscae]